MLEIVISILSIIIILIIFLIKISKNSFQYLLESPKNYIFNSNYIDSIKYESSPLIKCIDDFCILNNVYEKGYVIVSLSGGVDSMVLLAILLFLRKIHYFRIYTATIDYGQRKESNDESKFIKEYTNMFRIKSYISYIKNISRKKDDSGSRTEFEEESRNIRFNTYKDIITENMLDENTGVFVAHHLDDVMENIFTNSMRGANLLDLEVMRPISKINDITIFRPLLDFRKKIIYDFAYLYGIPYFLDTTPKWSNRGKMRNEIFPLFDNVFGIDWRNKLVQLGTQSNEWRNSIDILILNPWIASVELGTSGIIIPIMKSTTIIYTQIIMHSLHSISENMLKKSSINKIIDAISSKKTSIISLDCFRYAQLIENNQKLIIFNVKKITKGKTTNYYSGLINGIYDKTLCHGQKLNMIN